MMVCFVVVILVKIADQSGAAKADRPGHRAAKLARGAERCDVGGAFTGSAGSALPLRLEGAHGLPLSTLAARSVVSVSTSTSARNRCR